MIISPEKINELNKLCDQGAELKITGFNGLGFRFDTTGRITRTDASKPAIYEDCIFIEFGNQPSSYAPQRTDIFAPFSTEFDAKIHTPARTLIIEKIELPNGEVIFQNEDAEKYFQTAIAEGEKYDAKIKKEGRNIREVDPVTKKLPEIIGKPIIVDGVRCGVLTNFLTIANDGSVIVEFLVGPGVSNSFIRKDTRVCTTDLSGNIKFVEVNGKSKEECEFLDRIYENRQERILETSQNKGPAGPQ